jgi:O-antigen/teichoic acid export membrane protein
VWTVRGLSRRNVVLELTGLLGLTGVIVLLCSVLTWFITEPLFGPEFLGGRSLLLPLSLAAVFACGYRLVYNVAVSRHDVAACRWIAIVAGLNVVVAYPIAIWRFETEGAAWASAAGLASCTIIGFLMLLRRSSGRGFES